MGIFFELFIVPFQFSEQLFAEFDVRNVAIAARHHGFKRLSTAAGNFLRTFKHPHGRNVRNKSWRQNRAEQIKNAE